MLKLHLGNGTPLQYSCLENPMGGGAWYAAVHGVAKSRTWLSDFTFTFMHWRRKWHPLQCSCLENPRDGGAWWAAVYGVAQSRTRLTRPSRHLIQLLLLLPLFFSHHDCCWLMLCRFLLFFFIKFLPWSLRMPTPLPRSSFGEYPPIKNLALSTLLASCMGRDDQGSSHYPTDYSLSSC